MALQTYLTLLSYFMYVVFAYQEEYRGFDNCGSEGWHCNNNGNGLEIVYKCDYPFQGARLWLWTARIPSSAESFVIQDCNHVELHIDCTMGFRSYNLRRFHVKDVGHLEILKPLRPQIFLHDNDQIPHAPPEFILTNVRRITWYPGVLDKAAGRCRTKQQFLKKIDFTNVTLPDFDTNFAKELSIDSFILKNVTINGIQANSLNVSATLEIDISESQINKILEDSIIFSSEKVSLSRNQIEKIEENGITIQSQYFDFLGNKVYNILKNGFVVKAHGVRINYNTFDLLQSHAFASIEPGLKWFEGYKSFTKFEYEFRYNEVKSYKENSLSPFYQRYLESCSKMIIEGNLLYCNCDVPQSSWEINFPELFITTNRCFGSEFTLSTFVENCQSLICNGSHTVENCTIEIYTVEETSTAQISAETSSVFSETTEATLYISLENSELRPIPALHKSTMTTVLWTVFGTVICLIIFGGIAYWAKEKRKDNIMKEMSSYKHETNRAAIEDHEILIEE